MARYPQYSVTVLDALTYAGGVDNFPESLRNHAGFRFCHGNVRNTGLMEELLADADVIIHFAAETHVPRSLHDTLSFYETDVLGTQSVVGAVLKHPVERFIHISSSESYGTAVFAPMTEEHPLNPTTPYASAKAAADRLVYSYWVTYDLPCVILRPFNTYGPRMQLDDGRVVPSFIDQALRGKPVTIYGDGSQTRSFCYVSDLVDGLVRLMFSDERYPVNLGNPAEMTIREFAECVCRLTGAKPEFEHHPLPEDDPQRRRPDITKARTLLGWEPRVPLEEGLRLTIEYFRSHARAGADRFC